ncbi:hypothetical protein BVZ46_01584B, partial [Haemophilus influenzae]
CSGKLWQQRKSICKIFYS